MIIERMMKRLPRWLNRNDDFLKLLLGDPQAKKSDLGIESSSDYHCGSICNELEFLKERSAFLTQNRDFRNLSGPILDYLVKRITGIPRFLTESDERYIERIFHTFHLNGCKTRGTKESLSVFLSFFYRWFAVAEGIYSIVDSANFDEWTKSRNFEIELRSISKNAIKMEAGDSIEITKSITGSSYRRISFFSKSHTGTPILSLTLNGKEYSIEGNADGQWIHHSFYRRFEDTIDIRLTACGKCGADKFQIFDEEPPSFTVFLNPTNIRLDEENVIAYTESGEEGNTFKRETGAAGNWNYYLGNTALSVERNDFAKKMLSVWKPAGVKIYIEEIDSL